MNRIIKAFCSWSGGKDSCLSLYRALKKGINIKYLFTMFKEDGLRSRGHGLRPEVIKKQAELLEMNFIYGQATWNDYESIFKEKMLLLESKGVKIGVFGDIDLEPHRKWVIDACSHTNIEVYHPLWKEERRHIIEEFVDLGFKSLITTINNNVMSKRYLGQVFDSKMIKELEELKIDPCGENGEFHTVVIDGPIFKESLKLEKKGITDVQNYSMLDFILK